MTTKALPAEFEDLEPLRQSWALATEVERNRRHLSCSMQELKSFYDTVLPRAEAILDHLRALESAGRAASIPEESKNLFYLLLSLAEVSQSIEIHGQVGVVNGFAADRWIPEHEMNEWKALQQRLNPTPA